LGTSACTSANPTPSDTRVTSPMTGDHAPTLSQSERPYGQPPTNESDCVGHLSNTGMKRPRTNTPDSVGHLSNIAYESDHATRFPGACSLVVLFGCDLWSCSLRVHSMNNNESIRMVQRGQSRGPRPHKSSLSLTPLRNATTETCFQRSRWPTAQRRETAVKPDVYGRSARKIESASRRDPAPEDHLPTSRAKAERPRDVPVPQHTLARQRSPGPSPALRRDCNPSPEGRGQRG